jgi:catechol 2,3-dioxygenase-like lactoylglutathione lyase family enzyme
LLQVFDMPTSIAFYVDLLGFEIAGRSGPGREIGWVLLERDGTQLMLNTAYDVGERPPTPNPARIAVHADTVIYFGCPDIDGAYTHLQANGVEVTPPHITGYGFRALSVRDPDGFELVFHWRET